MVAKQKYIELCILDKSYRIACPQDKELALINAAKSLNSKIKQSAQSGQFENTEQLLLMVALNISHELQSVKNQFEQYQWQTQCKVNNLQSTVGKACVDEVECS